MKICLLGNLSQRESYYYQCRCYVELSYKGVQRKGMGFGDFTTIVSLAILTKQPTRAPSSMLVYRVS